MNSTTPIYISAATIYSPLGKTISSNFEALLRKESGVQLISDARFFSTEIPLSKINDIELCSTTGEYLFGTRFDTILMQCALQLKEETSIDLSSTDVLIILSTTKGNIELLNDTKLQEKLLLAYSAKKVANYFQNPNEPIVISNACISGISACIAGARYIKSGKYKHIVIIGCDALSKFVINGFTSFHAISKTTCRPFDKDRDGISLGEAAAACILSSEEKSSILLLGGAISNDANHISGPSRTGEELSFCINQSLLEGSVHAQDIDFICAHGTATSYNDEMESLAIEKSNLNDALVYSLKAHYGHTLGTAGILEILIAVECLKRNIILPSTGFESHGVTGQINVNNQLVEKELQYAIKTGSGFGGCNAAVLMKKLLE